MADLHIDFIHPHRPAARSGWLILLIGAVSLAAAVAWNVFVLEPDVEAAQAEATNLRATWMSHQPAALKLNDTQLAAEWQKALAINSRLDTPWQKLFAALESYVDQPVALLTIDPDIARKELLLTGEARNLDAVLDYVRFLKRQPMLAEVTLQSHQVNKQDHDKPVRFRISASWVHGQ
jgi:Tfp pilus assembly protein PilN